jgi:hypothetical protein
VNAYGVIAADVAHLTPGMEVTVEIAHTGVRSGVLRAVPALTPGTFRLALDEKDVSIVLPSGEPGVHLVHVLAPTAIP